MHVKMKLAALLLALASTSPAFAKDKSPLEGAWRMIKFEVASKGKLQPVPYSGQLIITEAGTLSAQAMNPDPNAAPTPFTANGYEALYGTVVINDSTNTFVATVQSALVRNLIGKKMERTFKVSGNRMVLSPIDPSEGWRVTYERYQK
ncbi:lipocalin-like domain-containing protein [Serratia sp. root2]|uniref:lipocalin-like domain-containing protein n=1 Tax=Serratia sp. root2 TaxID=3059676 RepID=UPI0028905E89|nr:lipocalin-like domain-containing protein [Serratia sp. root2]MDT3253756.1 lipocalin-like domain-containing protein [Serratia sp. root2]